MQNRLLIIDEDIGTTENKKGKLLGQKLETVDEFKYIGIIIKKTRTEKEKNVNANC